MRVLGFVVFLALVGLSLGQTFPDVPQSYAAVISANFHNTDGNVYTLSYQEYYDVNQRLLRTNGRMNSYDYASIQSVNDTVSFMYSWSDGKPDSCEVAIIPPNFRNLAALGPSIAFFDRAAATAVYVGQTTAVRDLLCDHWQTSMARNYTNSQGNWTVQLDTHIYFDANRRPVVGANVRVPVRVELTGSRVMQTFPYTTYPIYHVYDWVNWVSGVPPATVFQVPYRCTPRPLNPAISLPRTAVLSPQPATLTMPPLPKQFTTIVETKLNDSTTISTALKWSFDAQTRSERFDYYLRSFQDPTGQDTNIVVSSSLYLYGGSTASMDRTTGNNYQAIMRPGATSFSNCATVPASASPPPMSTMRAGSIPELFSDPNFLLENGGHQYVGRRVARGVTADVFSGFHQRTVRGVTFSFTMDMYFFPQGWEFPGRTNGSSQLPLRIINTGNYTDANGVVRNYRDTWDFFVFIPAAPPAADMSPASLSCPVSPIIPIPYLPPQDNDQSKAVAIGVVVGVLGTLLIAGLIVWYRRRREQANAGHTQLHDRN